MFSDEGDDIDSSQFQENPMRQIHPHALWLGHVGDVRDWRAVFDAGIQAIIDLAGNEPPAIPPRDLT